MAAPVSQTSVPAPGNLRLPLAGLGVIRFRGVFDVEFESQLVGESAAVLLRPIKASQIIQSDNEVGPAEQINCRANPSDAVIIET